jgi:nucleoside-diphosphate-sugar epimerase
MGRVLVTFASDFIGSVLVSAPHANGDEVFVIDLLRFRDTSVNGVVGDLRHPEVPEAALSFSPQTIFHPAARTSVLQAVQDPTAS